MPGPPHWASIPPTSSPRPLPVLAGPGAGEAEEPAAEQRAGQAEPGAGEGRPPQGPAAAGRERPRQHVSTPCCGLWALSARAARTQLQSSVHSARPGACMWALEEAGVPYGTGLLPGESRGGVQRDSFVQ